MHYVELIGLALAAAAPPVAQEAPPPRSFAWRVNDKVAAADPSRASADGFGVQMMITDDHEGFWKAWEGPTPPQLSVTSRTERGKPVHAMLVFSGCKAGADGNCNVTADFDITAPDGSSYGKQMSAQVWKLPPAPDYNLQLSEGSIGFSVEPSEMLGQYKLKARVTDHVARIALAVEAPVQVAEVGTKRAR
jgi:hypothetical protein